ncbi:TPA: hypothetical protein ACXP8Q_002604 [Klebsiella variicola subsp. variicola]
MSNSLQVHCIKDTEGYWTDGEMYPARQLWRAIAYFTQVHENPTQSGQAWRGYERALDIIFHH